MNQVYKTTKYDSFKVVKGNRSLNKTHLNNLAVSILRNNMLHVNPIIVNKEMEVIDGQHRLEVARRNNIPIYYMVADNANIVDVQILNGAQRIWSMQDYINSYIAKGNYNYVILDEFMKTYELPVSNSVALLSGMNNRSARLMQKFRSGDFVVTTLKEARILAEKLVDLRTYCDKSILNNAYFVRSVITMYRKSNFDHNLMLKKLNIWGKKIGRLPTERDYLRLFEEIYNYKSKSGYARLF